MRPRSFCNQVAFPVKAPVRNRATDRAASRPGSAPARTGGPSPPARPETGRTPGRGNKAQRRERPARISRTQESRNATRSGPGAVAWPGTDCPQTPEAPRSAGPEPRPPRARNGRGGGPGADKARGRKRPARTPGAKAAPHGPQRRTRDGRGGGPGAGVSRLGRSSRTGQCSGRSVQAGARQAPGPGAVWRSRLRCPDSTPSGHRAGQAGTTGAGAPLRARVPRRCPHSR